MNKLEVLATLDQVTAGLDYFREELRRRQEETAATIGQVNAFAEKVAEVYERIASHPAPDFAEIAAGSIDDLNLDPRDA